MAREPRFARVTGALFAAAALGELGVGFAVLAFPEALAEFLLAAPIEGVGVVIARMLGIALAALGLTWWLARRDLTERRLRLAPGFVGYNLGVGFLFLSYAMAANGPVPVPWLIAELHLLIGLAFAGAMLFRRHGSPIG
ncbi:MAG: hypothetical protein JNL68_15530 [Burkholderiales bacterium]|nr:hypothetical protein [Burkholderiales bacterium]